MENQNFEEAQSGVKHEPPVEFVLILPAPTSGGILRTFKQEDDVKPKWWVNSVRVTKFDTKWRGDSKLFEFFSFVRIASVS